MFYGSFGFQLNFKSTKFHGKLSKQSYELQISDESGFNDFNYAIIIYCITQWNYLHSYTTFENALLWVSVILISQDPVRIKMKKKLLISLNEQTEETLYHHSRIQVFDCRTRSFEPEATISCYIPRNPARWNCQFMIPVQYRQHKSTYEFS